jgi:hypothetical protein
MPGANCSIPECTVSRTDKHKGIGIFKVPTRKDDFYSTWRKNILDVIRRYRIVDKSFKNQILSGNVYVCERHFPVEAIEFTSKYILHCCFEVKKGPSYIRS